MRERARRLVGDTDDESLRGEVLALLLADERLDGTGVGEAARGGRCGSDLVVEIRPADEEPDLGNGLGLFDEADLRADREVEATAAGVEAVILLGDPLLVGDALSLPSGRAATSFGLTWFLAAVCDEGETTVASLRLERDTDGPASSSEEALEEESSLAAKEERRATAGDECALPPGVRLRLA